MSTPILIEEYNPDWKIWFQQLSSTLQAHLDDISYQDIIHLGSTSVPGLAAKPKIDLYVIVTDEQLTDVIGQLEAIGYRHQGDLGIPKREAFELVDSSLYDHLPFVPTHNLYTMIKDCSEYRKMTLFVRYLREFPDKAKAYGDLKKSLAKQYSYEQINDYADAKGDLIQQFLEDARQYFHDE